MQRSRQDFALDKTSTVPIEQARREIPEESGPESSSGGFIWIYLIRVSERRPSTLTVQFKKAPESPAHLDDGELNSSEQRPLHPHLA
ncbi:hypothetical protein SKAU_G00126930 [Synaphobranchus kaupii]|uniref:Uncharacterized protein n=1 Tax=Synaphobranchus kaupii TaxID=118154 RepID=A0A9Q1FPS3_SYNKA|nr:hypothetical protein SKAU_G00126930 [Synaphobranchus kaupii]